MKMPYRATALVWLIAASLLGLAVGLLVDWKGLLIGIMSALPAAALGIWVSVTIIEDLLERRHAQEWEHIRRAVLASITAQLTGAALQYTSLLPALGDYVELTEEMSRITPMRAALVQSLCADIQAMVSEQTDKTRLNALYSDVLPHLINVREMRMLHLQVPGNERDLSVLLQQLDDATMAWTETMHRDQTIGVTHKALARQAEQTLEALVATFRYLAQAA